MSAPSWLECRIRILLYSPSRLRTTAAAAGIPLAVVALLAAGQFPAPSLLASELRKLPPQDRKDVFVTGALFWKVEPLPNRSSNSALSEATPAGLVSAVDFGVPTGMGLRPGFPPLIEITVTPIDQQSVKVMVRAPESGPRLGGSPEDPAGWTQIVPLEVPYGQAASAILNAKGRHSCASVTLRCKVTSVTKLSGLGRHGSESVSASSFGTLCTLLCRACLGKG